MTSPTGGGYRVSIELAAKVNDYLRNFGLATKATRGLADAHRDVTKSAHALTGDLTAIGAAAKSSVTDLKATTRGVSSLQRAEEKLAQTRAKMPAAPKGGPTAPVIVPRSSGPRGYAGPDPGEVAAIGAGLLAASAVVVKFGMDLDKQMSAVRAATRATAADMGKLRQAALDAGADTKFSATEAAKGVEELSKASVSTKDILGGGLRGALSLAAAGELDVGEAAETAASAMTQFKLKGKDVPHVADLLAAGAGKAQGSVHDLGMALNQAGLIASQTGLSIEDTTGTLAAFANAGLTGSDAGTSFKTMLQALQAPSGKTKELMDDLGISAYNAQGRFIGITGLAEQLKTKLAKLTPELRDNAMAQIFGSDATRAASILYQQGAKGIQEWINKTNDAGYAAETARIKTDNLAGDVERLTGSLQTLAIESGSGVNGGLRALTKGTEALVDQFAELPTPVGATVTVLAGVTGAALVLGAGWVKLRRSTADMLAELRQVGPTGDRAATALASTGKWAGRAGLALAGLEIAGAVAANFHEAANATTEFPPRCSRWIRVRAVRMLSRRCTATASRTSPTTSSA